MIRPSERQNVHLQSLKNSDVKLQLLVSNLLNRRMEPYLLALKRGAMVNGHFFNHKGDEFSYVVEGELEVEIQGERQMLRQGDSLYIESAVPSKWMNVGKKEALLLWVLSPPKEQWN